MAVHVGGRGPGHLARMPGTGGVDRSAYLDFQFGWPRSAYWLDGGLYDSFGSVPNALSTGGAGFGQALRNGAWSGNLADGVPLIGDGGLGVWEARTNKCANFNANPTDLTGLTKSGDAASTLTVVDDVAALAAAGLQNICTNGKVFCLDNSAGVTAAQAAVTGAAGNTNNHTFSAFIRGGTGWIGRSPAINTTFTSSASYQRRVSVPLPTLNGTTLSITADAGQIVYFILNQLEEGAFATPPIVVQGLPATRTAVAQSVGGLVLPPSLEVRSRFKISAAPEASTFRRVFSINDGTTNNSLDVFIDSARTVRLFARSSAVTVAEIGTTAIEVGQDVNIVARYAANSFSLEVDGGAPVTDTSGAMPVGLNRIQFGVNAEMFGARVLNGEIASLSIREAA